MLPVVVATTPIVRLGQILGAVAALHTDAAATAAVATERLCSPLAQASTHPPTLSTPAIMPAPYISHGRRPTPCQATHCQGAARGLPPPPCLPRYCPVTCKPQHCAWCSSCTTRTACCTARQLSPARVRGHHVCYPAWQQCRPGAGAGACNALSTCYSTACSHATATARRSC